MGKGGTSVILEAESPDQVAAFRKLCLEYEATLPFSLCFQGFDEEMRTLPGKYARPDGCILLATHAGEIVGGVAMRPLPADPGDPEPACEMKRMFIRPAARGLGLGRLLAERLLDEARRAGYRMMKLDSETTFTAAVALYRSLGFRDIPRYNDDPLEHTVFMGRPL